MSNKFSNGRLRLPRPKVCKSDPPPDPPPLGISCYIDPNAITVFEGGSDSIQGWGLNENLAPLTGVEVRTVPDVDIQIFETLTNVDSPEEILVTVVALPGTYIVQVVFTFEDLTTCEKTLTVTVEPF